MYNIIRALYRITLKPACKGILILKSWLIIIWRLLLFHFLKGLETDPYGIRIGYVTRKKNMHFDDTNNKDEFQDGVYKRIEEFFIDKKLYSIIDIGCGSGFKLMKYFSDFQTTGMELPPALDYLKKTYPERVWIYSDFNFMPDKQYDMVISIDVIEHLIDPDNLLKYIKKIGPKYVVISTPDRDKLPYRSRLGPPINTAHIREWGQSEFINYLGQYIEIIESRVINHQDHYVIGVPKS